MMRLTAASVVMIFILASCSKPVPPENNPLLEPIKALEQAKAVQSQVMQQAEQQKRQLEAAEK